MTRADRVLIAAVAIIAVAAWPLGSAVAAGDPSRAVISGPAGDSAVTLGEDATYVVEGLTGDVTVQVADGAIAVTGSACPDRVCVNTGAVRSAGSVVACVPNGVVIRVGGEGPDGLDARMR